MGDTTGLSYRKVSGAETGACINSAETINDNRPRGAESKVYIVTREK